MELFFNDLSIHGQFHDRTTFRSAVERVMNIRNTIKRFGRELYCHRKVASMQVIKDKKIMQQAVQCLNREQRIAWTQWIGRQGGPFWEDLRRHDGDDYLECNGEIVTDNAIGEAAHCLFHNIDCVLVSMNPSDWCYSPLLVVWHNNAPERSVDLTNYWDAETLTNVLETANKPLQSWEELEKKAKNRCPNLIFFPESFGPLHGQPFVKSGAYQLLKRLVILQKFKNCFDENGKRTTQGQEIYQKHFTGDNAWFSDSSNTEKAKFKEKLTFSHLLSVANPFCPWHGKVKTLQLRIHFSWPVQARKPLYIAYVGPKITKQ